MDRPLGTTRHRAARPPPFSSSRLKGWSEILARHALRSCQTPSATTGKNGADIALVIDAVDLLHAGRIETFCIVSSGGDFTGLALRIREQGAKVVGFGEEKTPNAFRCACDRFVRTDRPGSVAPPPADSHRALATATLLIRQAIADLGAGDGGWHFLGTVGKQLRHSAPGFTSKDYGCAKLGTLVKRTDAFDVRRTGLLLDIRPKD